MSSAAFLRRTILRSKEKRDCEESGAIYIVCPDISAGLPKRSRLRSNRGDVRWNDAIPLSEVARARYDLSSAPMTLLRYILSAGAP